MVQTRIVQLWKHTAARQMGRHTAWDRIVPFITKKDVDSAAGGYHPCRSSISETQKKCPNHCAARTPATILASWDVATRKVRLASAQHDERFGKHAACGKRSGLPSEMRILLLAVKQGPNALFYLPNRTKCILLVPVMPILPHDRLDFTFWARGK
jgi:hypothetical protein